MSPLFVPNEPQAEGVKLSKPSLSIPVMQFLVNWLWVPDYNCKWWTQKQKAELIDSAISCHVAPPTGSLSSFPGVSAHKSGRSAQHGVVHPFSVDNSSPPSSFFSMGGLLFESPHACHSDSSVDLTLIAISPY
jgi:hypothetical protein